jgi:RHS repeat-associated protein
VVNQHSVDAEQAAASPSAGESTAGRVAGLAAIAMPKGGGAISGIGEKFMTNPVTGTATLTIPISLSPGRRGFGPSLSLGYDSGSGNTAFGFGWSLSLSSITRKTDKGLPSYDDALESDVFVLSGAEDLVPVLGADGRRERTHRTVNGIEYEVLGYLPRIEGLFARIERWVAVRTGITHWRSISRDNITTLYGWDEESRIADPLDARHIFSYLVCRSFDGKGNIIQYKYAREDGAELDTRPLHETNRGDAERHAQSYLKRIQYGNVRPYFADWSETGQETPLPTDWHFDIVLDYGDHATEAPKPSPDRPWRQRPDPFSNYRAGFEVRTYRRCQRILVFHHFEGETGVGRDCLIRATELEYQDQLTPPDPMNAGYSFLRAIRHTGYQRHGAGYQHASLPVLEFEYSQQQIGEEVLSLDADSSRNLPQGLGGERYQWADLNGDGLAGVLTVIDSSWWFKPNLSPTNEVPAPGGRMAIRARFGAMQPVRGLPSLNDLAGGGQRLLDLSGEGMLHVVTFEGAVPGFFSRTPEEGWRPLQSFESLPQLDWTDPNLVFVDLTGDGLADLLISEDGAFIFYASQGEAGYGPARCVRQPLNEERGPHLVFADSTHSVFLADMSGDGLTDLVRVRNGETCYWPNLGYGHFGAKVTMDFAPRFDGEDFDPQRVRLIDIDGSGTTDLIYLGREGVSAWFNRCGNSWTPPRPLPVFPAADNLSNVQALDLLGNGTGCLVWSSSLPSHSPAPLRYVDLMSGIKPHLLTRIRNNLGAETRLRYATSTRFYLADKQRGMPWTTKLPFPVQCVERVETYDWIARSHYVTRYSYHHGYFDGREREFRGFGMVEQIDTEEHRTDSALPGADANWDATSWAPPVRTRTWFHTGACLETGGVSRQYRHEYWIEPALQDDIPSGAGTGLSPAQRRAAREAMLLDETILPEPLSPDERREAFRALKGMTLRTEVFADDGSPRAGHPYTVTEQNFHLQRLQPKAGNRHAVFAAHPRETVSFHYERNPADPRVQHELTLEVDRFGNALRSVSVAYPRRTGTTLPESLLSAAFQGMLAYDQTRIHVVATKADVTVSVTDPVASPDAHRTPLPAERVTAEITGFMPAANHPGATNLFSFNELAAAFTTCWNGSRDIDYELVPRSDIDGEGMLPAIPARRIVEHARTVYRADDLTRLLALGDLEPGALPGESYQLALTPSLVSRLFEARVPDVTLAEGGYSHDDGGWWIPSGRLYYSSGDSDDAVTELGQARAHYYQPRRAVDPLGAVSRVEYDDYDLLPVKTVDPVGNTTRADNDYRVLLPATMTDPNLNRAAAAFDALGLVTASALQGKAAETLGDTLTGFDANLDEATLRAHLADPLADSASVLGDATSRMLYDLLAFQRTRDDPQPSPPAVYVLNRETHVADLGAQATRYRHMFIYSDGFGREIQRKEQAEAGPVMAGGPDVSSRWVGSGWTILDNKGRPVRRYEPFFAADHTFEFAPISGVSSVLCHDPPGRVVAMLHPDNSWEKTVFDAWRQVAWDVNDTVSASDPRLDPDVGPYLRRVLGDAPDAFISWYNKRIGGGLGATPEDQAANQVAAQKTQAHAGTPTVSHFDTLGRTCLTVVNNGGDQRHATRIAFDCEGKPLAVFDELGRRAFEFCRRERTPAGGFRYVAGYDVAGNCLYQNDMDRGERLSLLNVARQQIRAWSARGHTFRWRYDALKRPTHLFVTGDTGGEVLLERTVYGENMADRNLCGRLFRRYDQCGLLSHLRYDFKGNLVSSARQLALVYHRTIDWSALDRLAAPGELDEAAAALLAAGDIFTATTTYDALNRPVQVVLPHSPTMSPSILQPSYNEANLLEKVDVWVRHTAEPAALLPAETADLQPLTGVGYNARGQRTRIAFGSGATTEQEYDPLTFRLRRLVTRRPHAEPGQRVLQDLVYTYDPVGNITAIRDSADIANVIYFRNQRVEPSTAYTYDPVYRLIRATGREHLGQTGAALRPPSLVTHDDTARVRLDHPHDGQAMATYDESYTYDTAGNIESIVHQVTTGSWTRRFSYAEASMVTPTEASNRLSRSSLPGDAADGPFHGLFGYDVQGSMTRMPHLDTLVWDEQERLRSTARQVVSAGIPQTTYYAYDSDGLRIRKVTNAAASATRIRERIYLGALELYREYGADGTSVTLERETLHISAGEDRLAIIETRTAGVDPGPPQLVRYQHSNHLGSALLELSQRAEIISYEEYFPFGSTAYQAVRSALEAPKRYRYTGKERDDESDLYYYGARYYAPWLARWISADPAGLKGGRHLYAYAADNPVRLRDATGMAPTTAQDQAQFVQIFNETNSTDQKNAHARTLVTAFRDEKLSGQTAVERFKAVLDLTSNSTMFPTHFNEETIRKIGTESGAKPVEGDRGFRAELRDSVQYGTAKTMHPLSSDQIGHFLTAADIGYTTQENRNWIQKNIQEHADYAKAHPYLSVVRDMLTNNADVDTRLKLEMMNTQYERAMVGHELIADGTWAGGKAASTLAAPLVATDEDVANFKNGRLDLIKIDDSKNGNSYQDLLLSWVGYKFGVDMANGRFASRAEAARWLEMMLTDVDLKSVPASDPFYKDAQQMAGMLQQFREIQMRIHPREPQPVR